jgi:hypothetical protein
VVSCRVVPVGMERKEWGKANQGMRRRVVILAGQDDYCGIGGMVCSAYSLDLPARTSIWRLFYPHYLPHS